MSPYVGDASGEYLGGPKSWWLGLLLFEDVPPDEKTPPPLIIQKALFKIQEYVDNPRILPMVARRIGSKELHHRQGRISWVKTAQAELYRMDALTLVVGTPETPERDKFRGRTIEHIAKLSSIKSKNDKLESIKRTVERQLQIFRLAGLLDSKRITDTKPDGRKVGRASIRWFAEQLFTLLGLDKFLKAFRKWVSGSLKDVRATPKGKAVASLSLKVARAALGDNKPKTVGDYLKRGPP